MEHELLKMGVRSGWREHEVFGLEQSDRLNHLYVIGQTGTGKSTLLRNLLVQDIAAGRGVGLIDPHGDLASELLDYIPPKRTNEVIYFDPADETFCVGFNLFRLSTRKNWHLVASGVVNALKSIWRESWGPRLEYILYATVGALLQCENTSFLGIQRMFIDPHYRAWVTNQMHDPMLRQFWLQEFGGYDKRQMAEYVSPIQNKVGQLLFSPLLRNVLGQVGRGIDFRFLMDNRRIFVANLNKGALGDDKSNLIGCLLVTAFQLAAQSRSNVPVSKRVPFVLHCDEFQNFATDSYESILSEARKYGLGLTIAHQYIDQVSEVVRDAVFGNVGSIVSFRIGNKDARVFEEHFGCDYTASHFSNLSNHEVCAKLLSSGQQGDPFIGRTLAPLGKVFGRKEIVLRQSRQNFGKRRDRIEDKIQRWIGENG